MSTPGLGLDSGDLDVIVLHDGRTMQTHGPSRCVGPNCCIHNPSDHPLRDAPLNWRGDRQPPFMERVCSHGGGHPDADSVTFIEQVAPDYADTVSTHGCDGCC